jgi:hypothetical protein
MIVLQAAAAAPPPPAASAPAPPPAPPAPSPSSPVTAQDWAQKRNAAIASAKIKRLERKTGTMTTEHTFSPRQIAGPPTPSNGKTAIPTSLTATEMMSRSEKAALKHKQRNSFGAAKKPTYTPTTTTKNTTKTSSKVKGKGKKTTRPGAERLYKDAQNRRESLEKKRQSLDAEYSFAPTITKRGRNSSPLQQEQGKGLKRAELLYQDALKRKKHQEELTNNLTPTFKPQLSKVSAKTTKRGMKTRKPLYQPNSTQAREQEREKIRQRLAKEKKEKIDSTRISRCKYKSKRKNSDPEPNGVVERMELAAEKSKLLHEKLIQAKEAKENKELSFQPKLSSTKKQQQQRRRSGGSGGSSGSSGSSGSGGTFDRLYRGASEKRQRQEEMRKNKERAAEKELTFRPKIRTKDGKLRLAKQKVNNTSWIDQQVREGTMKLKHKKEAPTYKQVLEAREIQAQMEELTFQPSISSPFSSPEMSTDKRIASQCDVEKELVIDAETEKEKEKEKEKEQNDTTSKAEETSTTSDILEEGMQEGIVSGQEVF